MRYCTQCGKQISDTEERGPIENFVCVLKNCANFSGRASRSEFWVFQAILILVLSVIVPFAFFFFFLYLFAEIAGMSQVDMEQHSYFLSVFSKIFMFNVLTSVAVVFLSVAVSVRRLHDTGKSGWWFISWFIPLVNLYTFYLHIKRGDAGDNKYGSNPLILIYNRSN